MGVFCVVWSIEESFFLPSFKAFGVKADELERYVSRGIVVWGQQVQDALDMVKDCVNEINTFEDLQLLTILLEGGQNFDDLKSNSSIVISPDSFSVSRNLGS